MRIGIISEGHTDRAVIVNLIIGLVGLDSSDIEPLRPIYLKDETDKAANNPLTFSNWSIVKEECETRELIDGFLQIDGQEFVIIHIDTAEAELYGITRPDKKSNSYCRDLYVLVREKIVSWLGEEKNEIICAIAIEEIDAWVLTIFDGRMTCKLPNPKKTLIQVLNKKSINSSPTYDNFLALSDPFSSKKKLVKGGYRNLNCSLNFFCNEIENKVIPALIRQP